MGGILFPITHSMVTNLAPSAKIVSSEITASMIYTLASCSMAVASVTLTMDESKSASTFQIVLASFVIVEFCVGLFNPVAGTLRSKYVPDNLQGGILNIFRLPLNAVVVAGTYATDILPHYQVFGLVSFFFFAAAFLQATMIFSMANKSKSD